MKTLLIVYHSMTGGARQMAEAAARGATAPLAKELANELANEAQVNVQLTPAREALPADVIAAAGYLFVTPENLAAMSGVMKDFFDRTYYAALDQVAGRAYATLVCAGSDGSNAVRQVERIATGWRLRKAAEPIIVCTHAQTAQKILAPKIIAPGELRRCEEMGAALAAGLALGVF